MASFHYQLGTFTKEQYDALDTSLRDPDDPTYVNREVSQSDDILHSPTRGVFWLSEEEAAELEKDPQIEFIHKDPDRNPEDYPRPTSDELIISVEQSYRYNEPVKHRNRFASSTDYPSTPDATDLRRCGYQLLRTTRENGPKAKRDIWTSDNTTTSANIKKYGTGKDVDCVVVDNGTWIGHIEFINNRPQSESPQDYVGGNVLPGDGICDCLDMILDGPYYLDPDWFNAAPGSRLETRWDGTTVPTESEAKSWWSNTSNRSAAFASYGTVSIPTAYTRLDCNGDYDTTPYELSGSGHSTHGTQCGSQVFGRTHGWAYNANKWIIDGFSTQHGVGLTKVWDVQKIFHQAKPVNSKYGTKDPTISSNSWGFRITPTSSAYTFFRDTNAGGGTQYVSLDSDLGYNQPTRQKFCRYVGKHGEWPTYRMKSELRPQSIVTSAKEMVDVGVITVVAAGNSNQKQVHWNHPDYDNYWHSSSTGHFGDDTYFSQHGYQISPTTNRPGFPQNAGATFADPQSYTIQVTNNGATAYTMTGTDRLGSVSGDNPTITINRGDTVSFVVNASGHPFYIKTSAGGTGTGDTVQYPTATSNGSESGIVSWTPNQRTPSSLSGASFKYICENHSSMTGTITVRTGEVTKPTINIGALDDQYHPTANYYVNVVNDGSSAYTFSGAGTDRDGDLSGSNPQVDINVGDTMHFNVTASGHPFWIKTAQTTGTGDQASGVTNNGTESLTCEFTPTTVGTYYYICENHLAMSGTITVGAGTKERKVIYSDMGEAIDLFSPADGTLAATPGTYGTDVPRYDNTYDSKTGDTNWSDGSTGSPDSSRDTRFSGTSAACPVAAGLIATVVEFNRNWTHADVKTWLATLQNQDTTNNFYDGEVNTVGEDTGVNDDGYEDVNKLHGATPRVIYQGGTYSHTTKETTPKELKMSSSISITGSIGLSRE